MKRIIARLRWYLWMFSGPGPVDMYRNGWDKRSLDIATERWLGREPIEGIPPSVRKWREGIGG